MTKIVWMVKAGPARKNYFKKWLFLLFFLSHADDFAPLIMTATWANCMRKAHLTAVAALHQAGGAQSVMRSPAIAAAFGKFALWLRGHGLTPVSNFLWSNLRRNPRRRISGHDS